MQSDVEEPIRAVVRAFEAAFATERAELEKLAGPWATRLASQAFLLGPMSVLRAARRDRAFDRLANSGFANVELDARQEKEREKEKGGAAGAPILATRHLGAAVTAVIGAVRTAADAPTVKLAPSVHAALRGVLEPLVTAGALHLEDATDDGPNVRAAALVVPFYYAKHDVVRLATHLALEAASPSPLASGGIELFVSSRWDQRWFFLEELRAARAALVEVAPDLRPTDVTIVDVADPVSFLDEVRSAMDARSFAALSAFAYPMTEESAATRDALAKTAAAADVFVKNGRPSYGFWANQGKPCRVDVPQVMRPAPPASWCERRCDFERAPSFGAAASSALRNAIPSALLP